MRPLILAASFAALVAATPVAAQTMFDGTWKIDVSSAQLPSKPFGWTLSGGSFNCTLCTTPYRVPADGAFHKVAGQPYWDEVAVQVVNPRSIKTTYKKGGKVTDTVVRTLSADGKTSSWQEMDTSAPNGKVVEASGKSIRVSTGPKGSHAMSGSWRAGPVDSVSDEGLTMSIKTEGKTVSMTTPAGYDYTAIIGGPAVPVAGDLANTKAALAMPKPNTLIETDSQDGKTVSVLTLVAQPGGKRIVATAFDTKRGTTAKYMVIKQ